MLTCSRVLSGEPHQSSFHILFSFCFSSSDTTLSFWCRRCHGYQDTLNVRRVCCLNFDRHTHTLTHCTSTTLHTLWLLTQQTVKRQLWAFMMSACVLMYPHILSHRRCIWSLTPAVAVLSSHIYLCLDFVPICQFVAPAESNLAHHCCLEKFPPVSLAVSCQSD